MIKNIFILSFFVSLLFSFVSCTTIMNQTSKIFQARKQKNILELQQKYSKEVVLANGVKVIQVRIPSSELKDNIANDIQKIQDVLDLLYEDTNSETPNDSRVTPSYLISSDKIRRLSPEFSLSCYVAEREAYLDYQRYAKARAKIKKEEEEKRIEEERARKEREEKRQQDSIQRYREKELELYRKERTKYVNKDLLPFRNSPDLKGKIICYLGIGTKVEILQKVDDNWYAVSTYRESKGYVYASGLVSDINEISTQEGKDNARTETNYHKYPEDTNNNISPTNSVPAGATLIRGKRGGCYYINSSGQKVYVDRSLCN